ncbi:MAG: hypothetical protein SCARUB_04700 [Candidatus Scalindua rubra]|uniref:Gfo/Idh/MocA-like oxidoreductase N-terminal domain-containing protein n=1 Tax=Candidatus Scalindua rubra TaxID=1872076 RepID=A0A1E3X3I8_9BACT|nr:MAG: hypothetical protein SCARUB_04700 [Candidatus Scalindua rubra]
MALTFLILLLSAGIMIIIIPFARVMSLRMGMMSDTVNEFRTQENIPLLGGFPLLFTLVTMAIVSVKLSGDLELSESGILLIILLGGFLAFLVGLLYDLKVISPWIALLGQVIIAVILTFSEINFIHENQIFEELNALKLTYPGIQYFSELKTALSHGFDGFTVDTPAETHFEIAKQIIESGTHLLVEKPLSLNREEAVILQELSLKKCELNGWTCSIISSCNSEDKRGFDVRETGKTSISL